MLRDDDPRKLPMWTNQFFKVNDDSIFGNCGIKKGDLVYLADKRKWGEWELKNLKGKFGFFNEDDACDILNQISCKYCRGIIFRDDGIRCGNCGAEYIINP